MNILIEKNYGTPLGKVYSRLFSSNTNIKKFKNKSYKNGISEFFETDEFLIELVEFKIRKPLYNGSIISDSKGYIWRVERLHKGDEYLEIICGIEPTSDSIKLNADGGECLDAICAESNDWILHIGTQDAECMKSNQESNWFPERLIKSISLENPLTNINDNKVITQIPLILADERLYIHYLIAYKEFNVDDVSTWLAVEATKENLENWIGIE